MSGGGRILVVDDVARNIRLLETLLTPEGYEVIAASSGTEALDRVGDASPDVVLLDISMPGLSGIDALPTIRAIAPRAVVIMISATEDAAIAKRALAYGAFDYLVKPIDLTYLRRSIETALLMAQPEL